MMELRQVNETEIHDIYYVHMKRDFPAKERTPYMWFADGIKKGYLKLLVFIDHDNNTVGYASCAFPKNDKRFVFIQYFAVLPKFRGKGYGGLFLKLIEKHFAGKDLVLEAEDPDESNTGRDYLIRRKRIAFYLNSGFHILTNVRLNLFGVRMVCLAKTFREVENPARLWTDIYDNLLPWQWMQRFVRVYDTPDFGLGAVRPGYYRHFKGGIYKVLFTARHSETDERLIVYRPVKKDFSGYWVRPASMWTEPVSLNGKKQRRFVWVGR